jgi:hypothetical protein
MSVTASRRQRDQAVRGNEETSGRAGWKSNRSGTSEPAAGAAGVAAIGRGGYPGLRALAHLEVALRRQLGVGVHHDLAGYAELAGEVPGGRDRGAGTQAAVPDRGAELALDLRAQGAGTVFRYREKKLHWSPLSRADWTCYSYQ